MEIDDFLVNFREQFEYVDDDFVLTNKTRFVELEDWDSLVALSVIAMIDEKYGVNVSGDDIRASNSVGDLYLLVSERQK